MLLGQHHFMNFSSKLLIAILTTASLLSLAATYKVYMVDYDFIIINDLNEGETN